MILPPKHWQHPLRFCKRVFGLFAQNVGRAIQRYGAINGEQCASSFAYYAFFSLFPLILLCVAIATLWIYVSGVIVIICGGLAAASSRAALPEGPMRA
jgi:uncharacterized BrkB/YihY/UPF0761 family membrane protein